MSKVRFEWDEKKNKENITKHGVPFEVAQYAFADPDRVIAEEIARTFHESSAATADMAALPGVLGCRTLRCTIQVRLGSNPLRLPGGTAIFAASRRQFIKYPGSVTVRKRGAITVLAE